MRISVLTIVRGRRSHLRNQAIGLARSRRLPDQWHVVHMGRDDFQRPLGFEQAEVLPSEIEFSQSLVECSETLPLAKARNFAARQAKGELMIFLDADCIPSANLVNHFAAAVREDSKRLWMGNVRYLPETENPKQWAELELFEQGIPHPAQPDLQSGQRLTSTRYEMFWSLCYAVTQETFQKIGGFDETFDGYGGEDTDFAFAARQHGVQFGFVGATAFHQYHAVCKPPLNHFSAIIRNATVFRGKWNCWPMESWLQAFESRGLISWREDRIIVRRNPTNEEVEQAKIDVFAGA